MDGIDLESVRAKLSFWHGKSVGKVGSCLVTLLVVLGSARGFMIVNLGVPAELLYKLTAVLLLGLSTYGFLLRHSTRSHDLLALKNLLKLNLILGVVNISIEYILSGSVNLAGLYLFFAPYVIFLFLRVQTSYLEIAVAIISIAISLSVIGHFNLSLESVVDFDKAFEYIDKLRPNESEGVQGKTRTGDFYRASGYTGNPHDSANILGMALLFFLLRFILEKKSIYFLILLAAAFAISLTQSAANISILIVVSVIFFGYFMIKKRSLLHFSYGCFTIFGIVVLAMFSDGSMGVFARRMGEDGDWEGMLNQIESEEILSALPYYLLGHAYSFGAKVVDTEVAFLKIISQLGLIHAMVLFSIMLYPLHYYFKSRNPPYATLPSLAAVFFGFMSLVHYGSVFRVTSVFLFFMFFAISIKYIDFAKASNGASIKFSLPDRSAERNATV